MDKLKTVFRVTTKDNFKAMPYEGNKPGAAPRKISYVGPAFDSSPSVDKLVQDAAALSPDKNTAYEQWIAKQRGQNC